MHELGPERNAGQLRHVVQESKPKPAGEQPVSGELITCHGTGPGKVTVRRDPQWLAGGCQVPDLKALAGRDGGGAAGRVGRDDHGAHRREQPDLAEDARNAPVKRLLAAAPRGNQRLHVDDHRPDRQLPGLGEHVSQPGNARIAACHATPPSRRGRPAGCTTVRLDIKDLSPQREVMPRSAAGGGWAAWSRGNPRSPIVHGASAPPAAPGSPRGESPRSLTLAPPIAPCSTCKTTGSPTARYRSHDSALVTLANADRLQDSRSEADPISGPGDAATTRSQRLASSLQATSRSADLTGPARAPDTSGRPSRTGWEARMSAAGTAAPRWPRPRRARPRP